MKRSCNNNIGLPQAHQASDSDSASWEVEQQEGPVSPPPLQCRPCACRSSDHSGLLLHVVARCVLMPGKVNTRV